MKLRHATALALVGWYLMVPPMNSWPGLPWIDRDAPLSRWTTSAMFDSAKDCEIAREKHEHAYALAVKSTIDDGAVCIASDDPRFKGK